MQKIEKRNIANEEMVRSGIELLRGKWQEVDGKFVLPITGSFDTKGLDAYHMRRALEHLDIMTRNDPQFTNVNPDTSLPIYVTEDDALGNNNLVMDPEKYKELQDALKFTAQCASR